MGTRWVPCVEQELFSLPEHLRLPPGFRGIRVDRSLVFCVVLCRLLPYLLWSTASFYPFDIFKLAFLTDNNVTKLGSFYVIHRKERWSGKKWVISIYCLKNDTSIYYRPHVTWCITGHIKNIIGTLRYSSSTTLKKYHVETCIWIWMVLLDMGLILE